ncbi:MAG: Carbamoyl-phosphate synthase small chain, partial [uncultured Gemmatimonadetes bacterium]
GRTRCADAGGWARLRRRVVRRRGDGVRRGGVQHLHDRVPGGPHRPVVHRAARGDDLPAHRQLRRQPGGRGIGAAAGGGVHPARGAAGAQQLARDRNAARLPGAHRRGGHPGRRHPRAHPAHPLPRGHARRPGAGSGRRAAGADPRAALHGGAGPGGRRLHPRALHGAPGRRPALPGAGVRLRGQEQLPAPPGGARVRGHRDPLAHPGGGDRRRRRRRALRLQRTRRPGGRPARAGLHPRAGGARRAGLRDLPGPPADLPRLWGDYVQASLRPPGRQPPGAAGERRRGGDHLAEPRLRGAGRRERDPRRARAAGDARQPQRRHGGRGGAPRAARFLGAVPPRGGAGPARLGVSLRPLRGRDGAARGAEGRGRL